MQHPDLSSSLLPPRGALTSELREVKVSIHISSETVRGRGCQKPATVARIQQYDATGDEAPPASHELDAEDIQAIEDFLSSSQLLNDCGNARDPSSSTTLGMSQQSSTRSGSNASEDSLRALIVSALEIFLFGNKKRHAGFKWIEGGDWDGLVCIAPAVFHMPYLQVSSCPSVLLSSACFMVANVSPGCGSKGEAYAHDCHLTGTNGRRRVSKSAKAGQELRTATCSR